MDGSTCEARTKPYLHVLRGELGRARVSAVERRLSLARYVRRAERRAARVGRERMKPDLSRSQLIRTRDGVDVPS